MVYVVDGVIYYLRRCSKCEELFHTTAKNTIKPICYDCSNKQSPIKAIPKEEWLPLKRRWDRMNCDHDWKFVDIERRGYKTFAFFACEKCLKAVFVEATKFEDGE